VDSLPDRQEIRSAFYHRLHWLWPLLARRGVARLLRVGGWLLFALWLLFVLTTLVLRYAILPKVSDYQVNIEQAVSQAIGQPVRIGHIEARWRGLNPDLILDDLAVLDAQGERVFSLTRVESVLSWQTLWRLRPTLALLVIERPVLHVRRETDGRLSVAGLTAEGGDDPAFARWVLEQKRIRIHDATIVWEDRLRGAPPLVLEDLQFGLDNSGRWHRFGLSAVPPEALAARIDMRGEVAGDLGEALEHLSGKMFVELDYADLAGWRAWVDYPIHLPQGRGAVRVWGDLDDGEGRLSTDLALEEVRIRLGKQVPELDLASLRGRLEGRYKPGEWEVAGKKVELLTSDGTRVAPTDFRVEWRENPKNAAVNGSATATFLDLGNLARLASYMPLDEHSRELLQKFQPLGRIAELRASWGVEGEVLQHYSLKAGFENLGLRAEGYFPGAQGLSGRVDVTEKGGELQLLSGASSISLPAVFPEPDMVFDSLKAKANWKIADGVADIRLDNLEFSGADATGGARGSYRYTGQGPGEIDLVATITRANGAAVWRYMPHAVNVDARNWLKRGIVSGRGYDGRLTLKGNLKDFPFRDPATGTFLVTAKASDARIDYADGWPVIEHVDADMSFGVGMKIRASKGAIFGTALSNVSVDIPDFESQDEMLLVRGKVDGPTSEFLRFVNHSPVGDKIDHFTEGMKAVGNGSLDLQLDIPLRHVLDTSVRGNYAFRDNQLLLLSDLPTLQQVHGQLQLTESVIRSDEITGKAFGGPFKVKIGSQGGRIGVQAAGSASVAEVARHFGWPLLDRLGGSTNWKADVGVRTKSGDFVVTSDLLGITSPLPEPLAKKAGVAWPLRIEGIIPENSKDKEQYKISLGKLAQGLVIRRNDTLEKGVLSLGDPDMRLPDKGMAVRINVPQFDADLWKAAMAAKPSPASAGKADDGADAVSLVSLKTPQFRLLKRDFGALEVNLRPRDDGWLIGINTRDVLGDVLWKSAGEGGIEGNLKRLVVRRSTDAATPAASADAGKDALESLPAMNLTVDDFRLEEKALGKLELKARNEKGSWVLDALNLQNPDGALKGKAVWVNTGKQQTRLGFELTANDVGKLLGRLGYVDAVRRGTAKLAGDVQWNGTLTDIDYASLTGQMTVHAEKGQFNKLEPGVGRLLGLISLQSLPRRLTLDFRDIFSEGLAFDNIEGKLAINKGIMRTTDPLRIKGPAAQIEMQGETDLKNETQDLQVVVRPELSAVAAVGVTLINPVAGAATLLAGSVMSNNPLNRLFSYRYRVTGTWADPKVDKTGETAPPPAPAATAPTEPAKESK
jgi:uncharacterized protein (TIGR02099 family)